MILTLDLGTTVTKADVWSADGPVASGRAVLDTNHPAPGHDEQDPASWWPAAVRACADARAADPTAFDGVEAVGCTAARQTIVAVRADGSPTGAAILWSDRRAGAEARQLAPDAAAGEALRQQSGVYLHGGSVAAKVAWLAGHRPDELTSSRWLLSPRDLLVWQLTGEVATDDTFASATGCYDRDGGLIPALVGPWADRFADPVPPATVIGSLLGSAAAELGLRPGLPVVIGAGDRQSEVLGSGAGLTRAMVSWGTTANASLARAARTDPVPKGLITTRAATGGAWQLEAGLAAAGSLLAWIGQLTGLDPTALVEQAAASPPGARGLIVLPWLGGARAPWWRDDARAALVGLEPAHGPGDLARAAFEGVARDVARGLAAMGPLSPPPEGLALAGSGAGVAVWAEILTATTGLPAWCRRSSRSASDAATQAGAAAAGAALLTASAVGANWSLDHLDPVVEEVVPDRASIDRYAELAGPADRAAEAGLILGSPT
jgi:xylulokinase